MDRHEATYAHLSWPCGRTPDGEGLRLHAEISAAPAPAAAIYARSDINLDLYSPPDHLWKIRGGATPAEALQRALAQMAACEAWVSACVAAGAAELPALLALIQEGLAPLTSPPRASPT